MLEDSIDLSSGNFGNEMFVNIRNCNDTPMYANLHRFSMLVTELRVRRDRTSVLLLHIANYLPTLNAP